MHITKISLKLGAVTGLASAAYSIVDSYDVSNFFESFNFFSAGDPTNGFVKYTTLQAANTSSLAGIKDNAVYLGVDSKTLNPPGGRESTRLTSNKSYNRGLFIADIAHMPDSTCGLWPAFWTVSSNSDWPNSGEIDIIEGVNEQIGNIATLHTGPYCNLTNTNSIGGATQLHTNCNEDNGYTGCGVANNQTSAYGSGFNSAGGGVYAMEWTASYIAIFNFPRASIPADITSASPNTSSWGLPAANFTGPGCDISTAFVSHNIVFDTTFCGQWAGKAEVWNSSACFKEASTCEQYVAQNPKAFDAAFWQINSVKVYQDGAVKKREVVPVPFHA